MGQKRNGFEVFNTGSRIAQCFRIDCTIWFSSVVFSCVVPMDVVGSF